MVSPGQRTARRAKAPRLCNVVGTYVLQAVLLQHEVRPHIVEDLLSAVVERLPPHDLALRLDEPNVFDVGPFDGSPALSGSRWAKTSCRFTYESSFASGISAVVMAVLLVV